METGLSQFFILNMVVMFDCQALINYIKLFYNMFILYSSEYYSSLISPYVFN